MPARRFFSLLKAKRKIECVEAIDRIDEALIGSNNVTMKWYEQLRDKWVSRLTEIVPMDAPKASEKHYSDDEIKETQGVVLELFRQRKQMMGYGR
jgi:hypothetical protein